MHNRVIILLIITVMTFFVSSCSAHVSMSSSLKNKQNLNSSSNSSAASQYSLNKASKPVIITTTQAFENKSKDLGSTPSRLALALIINKLDSATVIEDLSKKTIQELFDILRQDAPQKSQTLEGLDQLYGLNDILASEGIYVNFQANNVVSAASEKSSLTWVDKFLKAINNTSSD